MFLLPNHADILHSSMLFNKSRPTCPYTSPTILKQPTTGRPTTVKRLLFKMLYIKTYGTDHIAGVTVGNEFILECVLRHCQKILTLSLERNRVLGHWSPRKSCLAVGLLSGKIYIKRHGFDPDCTDRIETSYAFYILQGNPLSNI